MIGVFGGSFDPIHFGHIEPLNELSEIFDFEEIRLIPTYKSPVKKPFYASADHRYRMAAIIASSGTNNFISDDIIEGQNHLYFTTERLYKHIHGSDYIDVNNSGIISIKAPITNLIKDIDFINENAEALDTRIDNNFTLISTIDTKIDNKISKQLELHNGRLSNIDSSFFPTISIE